MEPTFDQDWYEEASDPLMPLRVRGVMPSNNEKQFEGDSDLSHNDKVNDAISNNQDSSQPNKPSKNYPENMPGNGQPYDGYRPGKL